MSTHDDLIDFITDLSSSGADMSLHFYDILRVHPSAEQEVLESAYRRLLRLYHPDVNKHPLSDTATKIIISCYDILGDPIKRADYGVYLASKTERIQSASKVDREAQIAFYMERGEAYETNEKPDLAILDFTSVIEIAPHDSLAYQWRGMLYALEGEYALSIADYSKAINLEPTNFVAHQSRGWAYWNAGNTELAKVDLGKAINGWMRTGVHKSNISFMLLGYGVKYSNGDVKSRPIFDDSRPPMEAFVEELTIH